jgi:hypothetical protein
MGIKDIPSSFGAFEKFNREYEKKYFTYADSNSRVGSSTRDLFASWLPGLFAPLVRQGIYALLDDSMLMSFGFPKPLPGMRAAVRSMLKLRGRIIRFLPPRSKPHFFTDDKNRTYPRSYEIQKLGPPKLVALEEKGGLAS